jgi:hypothetical protein
MRTQEKRGQRIKEKDMESRIQESGDRREEKKN